MRLVIALFLCFVSHQTWAQKSNVNEETLGKFFHKYEYEKGGKRTVMQPKNRNFIQKLNPIPYVSVGLMFFYQRAITQQLDGECAFHNSCSQYTKYSVEKLGLIKGVLVGFYQLQSCFPTSFRDYPNYKVTNDIKILNQIGKEEK